MENARPTKSEAWSQGHRETGVKQAGRESAPPFLSLFRNKIMDWFTLASCLGIALPMVWILSDLF
jgi:hypothetical protein